MVNRNGLIRTRIRIDKPPKGTVASHSRYDSAVRAFKMIASCRSHPGVKRLGHSRIGHLEPALGARFSVALYIPGDAQLDNRAFLRAVAIAVEEAGVEYHWENFVEEDTVPDVGRLTL
jgi:glycine/D-amino acid oxidase-like deaminating enzyme